MGGTRLTACQNRQMPAEALRRPTDLALAHQFAAALASALGSNLLRVSLFGSLLGAITERGPTTI